MAEDGQERRYRLHGVAAWEHARAHGGTLRRYPMEAEGNEASPEVASDAEAAELLRQDPKRLFLDADLCESCLAVGESRPAVIGRIDPELAGYALCAACAKVEGILPLSAA